MLIKNGIFVKIGLKKYIRYFTSTFKNTMNIHSDIAFLTNQGRIK